MSELAPSTASPLSVAQRRVAGAAGYAFLVLFAVNFLNYLDRFLLTGAANIVALELKFGIDGIGYLSAAFIVVFTVATIPLGAWADRTKRKNVIAISVGIWSLATALTALASNLFFLLLSRMILGIGEAGYSPASNALLADYYRQARRARILSWLAIGFALGLMFGIVIGGAVANIGPGSWRWGFVFTGVPGLVLAYLAWRIREPRRNQADEEAGGASGEAPAQISPEMEALGVVVPRSVWGQLRLLLRIKTLLALMGMQVFAYFVLSASIVYLPTLFQQKDGFGLSSVQAGLFAGVGVAVAIIPGAILGGYLSDVLDRRHPGARVLVCGLGFLVGAPFYLLSAVVGVQTHNLVLYSIFFFATTLLLNLYVGPGSAALQDIVPPGLRATAVALVLFVGNLLGNAFAPTLVGALARALDPTHGQHFAQQVAGLDLSLALAYTCPPVLVIAGVIGILGARWMQADRLAAQRMQSREGNTL